MKTYDVGARIWTIQKNLENDVLWTSNWYSSDGDAVRLYINKSENGFELHCFSGIPGSHIFIDVLDYGILWNKAKLQIGFKHFKIITEYTFEEKSIILADYLSSIFCEYVNTTEYKQNEK